MKRGIEIKLIMFSQSLQNGSEKGLSLLLPWKDSPLVHRKERVGNDEAGIEIAFCPQSTARRTSTLGTVERKHPGCDLRETESAIDTGELLAENHGGRSFSLHFHHP